MIARANIFNAIRLLLIIAASILVQATAGLIFQMIVVAIITVALFAGWGNEKYVKRGDNSSAGGEAGGGGDDGYWGNHNDGHHGDYSIDGDSSDGGDSGDGGGDGGGGD